MEDEQVDSNSIFKRLIKAPKVSEEKIETEYDFDKATGTIRKYRQPSDNVGDLVIPGEIGGVEVKRIGDEAFADCNGISSVQVPYSTTSIGNSAFARCSNLVTVIMPSCVTSIGDFAFIDCINLYSISIPLGVTSIGKATFANCGGLTSMVIHEGVKSIGMNATLRCFSLTIYAVEGSFAHTYATENRIPYKVIRPSYSARGKIVDKTGKGLPGIRFIFKENMYVTAEDGSFTLIGLRGTTAVRPESTGGYLFKPSEITVSGPSDTAVFEASYSITGSLNVKQPEKAAEDAPKAITGRVTDRYGTGIPGIAVTCEGRQYVTDSEGGFRIEVITFPAKVKPDGADGYRFEPEEAEATSPGDIGNIVAYYSITGTMKDRSGMLIPEASVLCGEEIYYVDQEGRFTIPDVSGPVTVTPFGARGYQFKPQDAEVSGPRGEIAFLASYTVTGSIKDRDGKGIPGVTFMYGIPGVGFMSGDKAYTSDMDGNFSISDISGTAVIKPVSSEGYEFSPSELSVTGPANGIAFEATYSISGNLRDRSGKGLPGIKFTTGSKQYVTDPLGDFRVTGLSGNSVIKPVSNEGYSFSPAEIAVSGPREDDIFFILSYAIAGKVRDEDGKGIEGASVYAGGKVAVTDWDGGFMVSGLSGGVSVTAQKDGYSFAGRAVEVNGPSIGIEIVGAREETIDVAEPEAVANSEGHAGEEEGIRVIEIAYSTDADGNFDIEDISGTVILRPVSKEGYIFTPSEIVVSGPEDEIYFEVSYLVSGTVRDEEGFAIEGATVSAAGKSALSDLSGHFTLSGLSGNALVEASKEGYSFKTGPIDVKGPTRDLEFVAYNRVAGRVADAFGNGLEGVTISSGDRSAVTDPDGSFALLGLREGDVLSASKQGYDFSPRQVQVARPWGDIVFTASYVVTGRVMDSSGRGIPGVIISSSSGSVSTAEDGTFTIGGLSGPESIIPTKEKYSFSPRLHEVTGPAGGIDFRAGYRITGRIVDASGKGVGGVAVMVGAKDEEQRN